jgi:hypothetical protein
VEELHHTLPELEELHIVLAVEEPRTGLVVRHSAGKTEAGQSVGHIAVVAVRIVVVDHIAVGVHIVVVDIHKAVAVVHNRIVVVAPIGWVVAPVADSTVVAALGQDMEIVEPHFEDMEIAAADLVAAVQAYYIPTVLEDTVKMSCKMLELQVVDMATVAAQKQSPDAVA